MSPFMQWGHHVVMGPFLKSPYMAACTILWCGLAKELDDPSKSGFLYFDCKYF